MELGLSNNCIKMKLPDGNVVDVLSPVLEEIEKWVQDDISKPESGGYIVGYQHKNTGNISLEAVSHPYLLDVKNRVRFDIKDPRHQHFLRKAKRNKSYYMGVWHTHPQTDIRQSPFCSLHSSEWQTVQSVADSRERNTS